MQYVISLANVTMVVVLLTTGIDVHWCVSLTNTTVLISSPLHATSSLAAVYITLQMMET